MEKMSRKKLLDYIEHEEIAFQFGDGLMCITHPDGDYGDEDLAQSIAKDIEGIDLLILVDKGLLLCLPDQDTREVIFEAA